MMEFIGQLGTWGPLLIVLTLVNVALIVRYALKLFGGSPDQSVDINRILVVAILVVAIGAFSHYAGLYSGLQLYGQLSPAMFARGYAVSLIAMMYGFVVFIISILCWFGLSIRLKSIRSKHSEQYV